MRPSRAIKRLVRWVPYKDGRPGLHPTWPYDAWARVFNCEERLLRLWRWRVIAPLRHACGLPSHCHGPGGWTDERDRSRGVWSDDLGSYTDERGYVWSAEAAIMSGVASYPPRPSDEPARWRPPAPATPEKPGGGEAEAHKKTLSPEVRRENSP